MPSFDRQWPSLASVDAAATPLAPPPLTGLADNCGIFSYRLLVDDRGAPPEGRNGTEGPVMLVMADFLRTAR
jgi:hypothetical protein